MGQVVRGIAAIIPAVVLGACGPPVDADPGDGSAGQPVSFETDEGTALAFDISPDGEGIVLDLLGQLWTIPATGGRAAQLTDAVRDQSEDLNPSFSPDGSHIVFSGDRGGIQGVWILAAEGGEPRLVARTEPAPPVWQHSGPAWAPGGQRIAFADVDRLYVHHLDQDSTVAVELDVVPEGPPQPAWLPDGRIVAAFPPASWWVDPSGPLRIIDPVTGASEAVDTSGRNGASPAVSPDGIRIAYLAADDEGRWQVWVQPVAGGEAVQVTDEKDVSPARIRWAGRTDLLYSARGRLWRVDTATGMQREVPFTATVAFERDAPELPPLRFPEAGTEVLARGHTGLALSPDGERVALFALGQLWEWRVGEDPVSVRPVPATAGWVNWSPDGTRVVWSAGLGGAEDLYITELASAETRRLTALPGKAYRPAWSPDGRHVAFVYWPWPAYPTSDAREDQRGHFAVVPADEEMVADRSQALLLGEITEPGPWQWIPGPMVQEVPVWSPDSDALLYHPARGPGWRTRWWREPSGGWRLLGLDGRVRDLERLSVAATFLNWAPHSRLTYVHANQLWQAEVQGDLVEGPRKLSEDGALYPSVARDGTILFVGADGYRLRRPDGSTESLGWPLSYRVPDPDPLLIRNARIVRGDGTPPGNVSDLLLEGGRITAVAPGGTLDPESGATIIDAAGRTVMPGLIDLHIHGTEYAAYLASLYHGVTAVRETGAPLARTAALRDLTEAGIYPGPRIVLGGPQVNPGETHPSSGSSVQNVRDSGDSERALDLLQAFGASFAKMRGARNWSAGADFVRAAQRRGMRVSGHCGYPLPLIAAGVDHKDHMGDCRYLQEPRADLIGLYRAVGFTLVPTLVNSATWSGRAQAGTTGPLAEVEDVGSLLTPELRWYGGYDRSVGDVAYDPEGRTPLLERLADKRRSGIPSATGTDEWYLPGAIHLELEDLVASGLSPLEAITAATATAARLLGAADEIGTIEVGMRADLVLIEGDPIQDIRETRHVWKVIKGGQVVDREGILEWFRDSR